MVSELTDHGRHYLEHVPAGGGGASGGVLTLSEECGAGLGLGQGVAERSGFRQVGGLS
jgi:hypothetical protein